MGHILNDDRLMLQMLCTILVIMCVSRLDTVLGHVRVALKWSSGYPKAKQPHHYRFHMMISMLFWRGGLLSLSVPNTTWNPGVVV